MTAAQPYSAFHGSSHHNISHPFACQSLTATFPILPSYRMHVRIMLPYAHTLPVCAMEAASRAGFSLDTPSLRPAMPRLASRLRLIKQGISISIFDRSVARITTNNPSEQLHSQTCSVCLHIFPAQSNVHSYCICPFRRSQKTTMSAFACLATLQGLLCTPSRLRVVIELLTPCSCIKCFDEMGRPQTQVRYVSARTPVCRDSEAVKAALHARRRHALGYCCATWTIGRLANTRHVRCPSTSDM
jgi:hypothetical protein